MSKSLQDQFCHPLCAATALIPLKPQTGRADGNRVDHSIRRGSNVLPARATDRQRPVHEIIGALLGQDLAQRCQGVTWSFIKVVV